MFSVMYKFWKKIKKHMHIEYYQDFKFLMEAFKSWVDEKPDWQ